MLKLFSDQTKTQNTHHGLSVCVFWFRLTPTNETARTIKFNHTYVIRMQVNHNIINLNGSKTCLTSVCLSPFRVFVCFFGSMHFHGRRDGVFRISSVISDTWYLGIQVGQNRVIPITIEDSFLLFSVRIWPTMNNILGQLTTKISGAEWLNGAIYRRYESRIMDI